MAASCSQCGKRAHKWCGGCKKLRYCGVECQKADWNDHKTNCDKCFVCDNAAVSEFDCHCKHGRYCSAQCHETGWDRHKRKCLWCTKCGILVGPKLVEISFFNFCGGCAPNIISELQSIPPIKHVCDCGKIYESLHSARKDWPHHSHYCWTMRGLSIWGPVEINSCIS